jgi:hypothetical protein
LLNGLDYLRRTDIPITAYSSLFNDGKCCVYALQKIFRKLNRQIFRVLPLFQFDRMAFRGDSTAQFYRGGNVGLTVDDGNGDVKDAMVVYGGAYALLALNHDAVLFQTHIVRKIPWLLWSYRQIPSPDMIADPATGNDRNNDRAKAR